MKPIRIYSLESLTEEELATTMAKCARSPEPFDEIAKTVTEEGAEQFHEKYVLGYGHASVAEIAVPNFAFEGVSILASKILESMPRGAYQEKSTRAQNFLFKDDAGHYTAYYIPPSLEGQHRELYVKAMEALFSAYEEMLPLLRDYIFRQMGTDKFIAQKRAFDAARYLLPIGTQTNLGMRLNARDTAILISKLLSSPFEEFRDLGNQFHDVAKGHLPTLVRHTSSNAFIRSQRDIVWQFATKMDVAKTETPTRNLCRIVGAPSEDDAILAVVRAFLANHGIEHWTAYDLTREKCLKFLNDLFYQRGDHDPFPDEFDTVPLTVEMVMDYGAYRDLQRHRYCTQYTQLPTTALGFDTPEDIEAVGLGDKYRHIMREADDRAYSLYVADAPQGSWLYVIPLAYRNRVTMQMTLKQAAYMIELRSKPQGHISYRRIVAELWSDLMNRMPTLTKYIRCSPVPGTASDHGSFTGLDPQ